MQLQTVVAVKALEFKGGIMPILILLLFATENEEFFSVSHENAKNGYTWEVIEDGCRKPLPNTVYLENGDGEVCFTQQPPS